VHIYVGQGNKGVRPELKRILPSTSLKKTSPRRRKNKCIKSRGEIRLVLGIDISEGSQVMEMADTMVVGMARGLIFSVNLLKEWVDKAWSTHMRLALLVQTLARGWFCFKFRSATEAEWDLTRPWSIDSTPLVLK
jgi:hypothetical protein